MESEQTGHESLQMGKILVLGGAVIGLFAVAQFFAFTLLRVFGHVTVQVKALLFRW